tara:strand:- start:54 stop:365 length:312 start_codon:yes stop_codon:yes gene_type:complete
MNKEKDMNGNIKITVDFCNGTEFKNVNIQVNRECTVSQLQIKLRKYMKVKPCVAVFIFFQYEKFFFEREKLYGGNVLLKDIQSELCITILKVKMLLENAFGEN